MCVVLGDVGLVNFSIFQEDINHSETCIFAYQQAEAAMHFRIIHIILKSVPTGTNRSG